MRKLDSGCLDHWALHPVACSPRTDCEQNNRYKGEREEHPVDNDDINILTLDARVLWQDSPLDPGESLERVELSAVGVVKATVKPSAESCGDGCSTSEPKDPSQEDAKKVDMVVSDEFTCHIERVRKRRIGAVAHDRTTRCGTTTKQDLSLTRQSGSTNFPRNWSVLRRKRP